jgi:hypothetical protein
MLSCSGTEVAPQETGSTTTVTVSPGIDPGIGSPQYRAAHMAATASTRTSTSPDYSDVRVPAQMSIAIEDQRVRVRPPAENRPGFTQKKSPDGWYELSEVDISDAQIRGRAPFGGLISGKYRLAIDRLTGDAQFGSFRGLCEKAATGPTERKF